MICPNCGGKGRIILVTWLGQEQKSKPCSVCSGNGEVDIRSVYGQQVVDAIRSCCDTCGMPASKCRCEKENE